MTDPSLIFGKYEIVSRLAVGGMGEVFYAVQRGVRGFERPAILKNLLPDLALQEGFIDQFLDEARVAATLNHPNVVSIYEVGLWNGTYFIAMEYIQGRNLSQLIRAAMVANRNVPPLIAAQLIRDAALGLHHAHVATDAQGQPLHIVHRDVSPQNIMVRDDGVTKVVDFGIARAANRATRTQTGSIKGKLAYMPPEQLLASEELTAAADQYALGVVLWELCTGRRLFRAANELELMKKVAAAEVPRLTEVVPGLPPPLADVVQRMVSMEPRHRYESCAQVAAELEAVMSQLSPPTRESPVAAFVRTLGPPDAPTPQLTPSAPKSNFVISLSQPRASDPQRDAVTRAGPSAAGPVVSPSPAPKRRGLIIGAVGTLVVAGVIAAVLLTRPPPPAAVPVPVPVPVVVVEPPPPPVPVEVKPEPVVEPVVVPAAPARWALTTTPPGVTVRLDGRPLGKTPLELTVSPGEVHFLLLEHPGYRRDERELPALEAGESSALLVPLTQLTQRPPPGKTASPATNAGPGFLSLSTTPWTKVTVGSEFLGSTPLFKQRLPAGEHTVTLINEGKNLHVTRKITIRSGEVTKLDLSL